MTAVTGNRHLDNRHFFMVGFMFWVLFWVLFWGLFPALGYWSVFLMIFLLFFWITASAIAAKLSLHSKYVNKCFIYMKTFVARQISFGFSSDFG
jgi:hypothetical protein